MTQSKEYEASRETDKISRSQSPVSAKRKPSVQEDDEKAVPLENKVTQKVQEFTIRRTRTLKRIFAIYVVKQIIIVLAAVWILGAAGMLLISCASYHLFLRKIKKRVPVTLKVYEEVRQQVFAEYGITRDIPMKYVSGITTPMILGVRKPEILLPEIAYSREELILILRHELTHYCHRDIIKKYLFEFVRCVYWFCPVVRILKKYADRDMELYCDERVIARQSMDYRKEYSMTILRTLKEAHTEETGQLTACLNEDKGKNEMKERFLHILSEKNKKKGIGVLAACMAAVLVLCGINVRWFRDAADQAKAVKAAEMTVKKTVSVVQEAAEELTNKEALTQEEQIENVLILGKIDDLHKYPDCIVTVCLNKKKNVVSLKTVSRLQMVQYKSEKVKLQKLYEKDKQAFYDTIEQMMSIHFNRIVEVEGTGFEKIIDRLGGIEIELSEREAEYLDSTNFISKRENRNVKPGKQIMNGNQALGYSRVSKVPYIGGAKNEFGRECRHLDISLAVLKKVKNLSREEAIDLVTLAADNIKTDFSVEELKSLMNQWLESKFTIQLQFYREDGTYYVDKIEIAPSK